MDTVGEDELLTCDAILTSRVPFGDLLTKDLEFVEMRLSRNPPDAEKAALKKLAEDLISEQSFQRLQRPAQGPGPARGGAALWTGARAVAAGARW